MANNLSEISSVSRCTKHPDLRPLPGVCSSCLRESLHQLLVSWETTMTTEYPSQRLQLKSPSYSSSSNGHDTLLGGPWSPPAGSQRKRPGRHRRNGSAVSEGGSVLLAVRVGSSMREDRSVASALGRSDEEQDEEGVKTVKRRFWSKLIHFRSWRSKGKEGWRHHRRHHSGTLKDIFTY